MRVFFFLLFNCTEHPTTRGGTVCVSPRFPNRGIVALATMRANRITRQRVNNIIIVPRMLRARRTWGFFISGR